MFPERSGRRLPSHILERFVASSRRPMTRPLRTTAIRSSPSRLPSLPLRDLSACRRPTLSRPFVFAYIRAHAGYSFCIVAFCGVDDARVELVDVCRPACLSFAQVLAYTSVYMPGSVGTPCRREPHIIRACAVCKGALMSWTSQSAVHISTRMTGL